MKIMVAFATLSGNTMLVAQAIADYLQELGHTVETQDLLQTGPERFKEYDLVFIGSSTYGDGDLNPIAETFFGSGEISNHDCGDTDFAIFALGDSAYANFAESGQIIKAKLEEMKAHILGEIFTIDGYPDEQVITAVKKWAAGILNLGQK